MTFLRGDIFVVNKFYGIVGSEQDSGRPAVIVSNNVGNQHSECVEIVYLTTKDKKPLPTHTEVLCKVPSTALCEQVHTVYKERLGDFIRSATGAEMAAIDEALKISLDLNDKRQRATLEEQKRIIDNQGGQIETLLKTNEQLQEKLKKAKEIEIDGNALIKLQAERDTYKTMYEALLNRFIDK